MRKLMLLFFYVVCAFGCFEQSVTGNQKIIKVPVNASGALTNALIYLPQNYEQSPEDYPLIVYFNGKGQGGTDIKKMLGDGLPKSIAKGIQPEAVVDGRTYRFIVFSPQGPEWSFHEKDLKYMLPYITSKYRIDTTRIYVTGISAGAGGAYSCVATEDSGFAKKVAAVVAVSPLALDFSQDEVLRQGIKKYATPILDICGTDDVMVVNARRYDTLINNVNPPVKYKLIEIEHGKHTVSDTAYNIKSKFGDFGKNVYEWMLQYTTAGTFTDTAKTVASACKGKRIYITKHPDDNIYLNGNSFDYKAGDTLVLTAAQNPYAYAELYYFTKGTDACPIVIINEGGKVKFTTGFSLTGCRHVKVTGTGTKDKYGFYISQDQGYGVGISAQGRSSNIEIDHLEMYNKHYGVWLKHEADCADSLQFPHWVLHDVSIHDNFIHHMLQEGMYLGSTDPNGQRTVTCGTKVVSPKPMRLGNIRIYNNIIDSTYRGGIQLSGADSGYNEIYNNTVTHSGLEFNSQQGNGIVIGGYTHADIHDNYIRTTFGAGIFSLGAGMIKIYNNLVDSSGYLNRKGANGSSNIMVDTRPTGIPSPGQLNPVLTRFNIKNNRLGINTDVNIRIYKTFDTYKKANIICNNGTVSVADGIDWIKDCSSTGKANK